MNAERALTLFLIVTLGLVFNVGLLGLVGLFTLDLMALI